MADAIDTPTLAELDEALGALYAHVMYGASYEPKVVEQTAVCLYGAADESAVTAKLAELQFAIVDREIRSNGSRSFGFVEFEP